MEVDGVLAGDHLVLATLAFLHHGCCLGWSEVRLVASLVAMAEKSFLVLAPPPSGCETSPGSSINCMLPIATVASFIHVQCRKGFHPPTIIRTNLI